jgi:hypothetical protein
MPLTPAHQVTLDALSLPHCGHGLSIITTVVFSHVEIKLAESEEIVSL